MAFEITITNAGRAAIAALTGTDQVVISQIGVSQTHQIVSWATTALTNETKRITAFGGSIVDAQTMSIQMLDDSADSYNLRSFALYTSTGVLFAIYSQNEIISAKSAASLLLLQIDITLTALGTAAITFGDTNFVNPPASDTVAGVTQRATEAEILAGLNNTKHITPFRLKNKIIGLITALLDMNLNTTGHVVLFGLVINWGETPSLAPDQSATVTFSKPFSEAFQVIPAVHTGAAQDDVFPMVIGLTNTTATLARGRISGIITNGKVSYVAFGKA
jgi:hypothetical protein